MIEIRNAQFRNKGAYLMLLSIFDAFDRLGKKENFAMAPVVSDSQTPFELRCKYNLYQLIKFYKYRVEWGFIGDFLSPKVKQLYGLVSRKDISAVLDCSGFSYSDQWGNIALHELKVMSSTWKKSQTKSILLPQAFGPFENKRSRSLMFDILNNIDLIYARDPLSYQYLNDLNPSATEKIKLAGDFTVLLKPNASDYINTRWFQGKACFVPNKRMIDKNSCSKSEYISFFQFVVAYLGKNNLDLFILVHEDNDLVLAQELCNATDEQVQILVEKDPLVLKAILGSTYLNIVSRFHAAVSSLSQAVPTIGTGWSHKYDYLFRDFQSEAFLVQHLNDSHFIAGLIDNILNPSSRAEMVLELSRLSQLRESDVFKMWEDVFTLLYSDSPRDL